MIYTRRYFYTWLLGLGCLVAPSALGAGCSRPAASLGPALQFSVQCVPRDLATGRLSRESFGVSVVGAGGTQFNSVNEPQVAATFTLEAWPGGTPIDATTSWDDVHFSLTPSSPLADGWYVVRTQQTETVHWSLADGWVSGPLNGLEGCHFHVGSLPLLVASIEPETGPFLHRLTIRGTEPLSSAPSLVAQGLVDVTNAGATVACSYSSQTSNAHDDLVTTGELRYDCEAIDYSQPLVVVVHPGIVAAAGGAPLTDLGGNVDASVTWVPSMDGRFSPRTLDPTALPGGAS